MPAMSRLQHHALMSTTTKVRVAMARLARCAGIARDVRTRGGKVRRCEAAGKRVGMKPTNDDGRTNGRLHEWRPEVAQWPTPYEVEVAGGGRLQAR